MKNVLQLLPFLLGGLLGFYSCSSSMNSSEWKAFATGPESGFTGRKTVDNTTYNAIIKPRELMYINECVSRGNCKQTLSEFAKDLGTMLYVDYMIETQGSFTPEQRTHSSLWSPSEFFAVMGSDTLECSLFHNEIAPFDNQMRFAMAFDTAGVQNRSRLLLIFKNSVLRDGDVYFTYNLEELQQAPRLKT